MPTNRKRTTRTPRGKRAMTPEYVEHLKLMDFLGELAPHEIADAKQAGVFKWDAIVKKWNRQKNAKKNDEG